MREFKNIRVYLRAGPLLHLTLIALQAGNWIYQRTDKHPLANPAPIAVIALVILTGIPGAILGPLPLNRIEVKEGQARGLAIGTASHGIDTARALQVNETAGAFAGLVMGPNAPAAATLLPLLWKPVF